MNQRLIRLIVHLCSWYNPLYSLLTVYDWQRSTGFWNKSNYLYIYIYTIPFKSSGSHFSIFFTILVAAWRLEWVRMLWISAVNIHLGLWSSWQKSLTLWPCNTCSFLTITDRIYESMTKIGCFCCDGETGEKQEKEETYSRFPTRHDPYMYA